MRTLHAGSYHRLASQEALWRAWRYCRRGKRRNPTVADFEIDCDQHLLTLHRADNRALSAIALAAASYQRSQNPPDCCPGGARPCGASRRAGRDWPGVRTPFHRPVIRRRARPGPHRAALYFLACQRRYAWRLHLDIRAYFLSINHSRLLALFAERIGDADTLALLRLIIAASEQVYRSHLAAATWARAVLPSGGACR